MCTLKCIHLLACSCQYHCSRVQTCATKHNACNKLQTCSRVATHVHECVTIHKRPCRVYVSTHSIMLHIKMFTSVSLPVSRVHRHVHTCHHTCIPPYTQKHMIAKPHRHTTITTLLTLKGAHAYTRTSSTMALPILCVH